MLTVGSLFTGIGGIDLGFERAGMRVVWQCEINPYARAVLRKRWPTVPLHGDVRYVGAQTVPGVEVVCGGFPCQDVSQIGQRQGIRGRRSGLWTEFARIVRELRPRYVIVENVPGLRGRGLDIVLGDLAASGYDAEWDCIPASAVGAPHRRDRLFVVANPKRNGLEGVFPQGPATRAAFGDGAWSPEPDVDRVDHGTASRVDRITCLGNAVVPQVAEWIGKQIVKHARRNT